MIRGVRSPGGLQHFRFLAFPRLSGSPEMTLHIVWESSILEIQDTYLHLFIQEVKARLVSPKVLGQGLLVITSLPTGRWEGFQSTCTPGHAPPHCGVPTGGQGAC